MLDPLKEIGAGEAIRTLDPNLGKGQFAPSKEFTLVRSVPSQCALARDLCSLSFSTGNNPDGL
ncbi:hypothetical protein EN816_32355 [Mesorhizobium sp. M8A.F.Ca.ET.173.01.1.1]|nr:hypothetical protein EN816_32355 [Mesorhizobium sp. M8A.F.Ca.ET.173.01.1.1]